LFARLDGTSGLPIFDLMTDIFSKRYRWAWFVSLLLLGGFLLTSISSYLVTRGNIRTTITESTLPLTSDNVYSEIQRDLLRPVFIASLMANDTFLREWAISGEQDEDAISRYLNEIKIKYGTVTSFFVSEHTRKYFHAHGLLKTVREDEPRDIWYFRVRDMLEPYEINVDADLANADEMTIFINYRTFDFDGEFIGATGVGLTVRSVNNLISRYEAKYDRQIYFTNAEGEMVLRPMNSPMLKYRHLSEIEGLSEYAGELLSDQRSKLRYYREGQNRLLHCRYVPELDWYLIVEQGESKMLAPVKEQLFVNIALAFLVTFVVGFICIASIKRQQLKLERRNQALSQINAENEAQKVALIESGAELAHANQALENLNKEKDEFIGILAHDLRNPLNSIIGLCELAEDDFEEFKSEGLISEIQASGERMLELTKRLLDVSQVENFHGEVKMHDVLLSEVIESAVEHLKYEAVKKKISLSMDVSACSGVTIPSHRDWLELCVINLLSNAVKYTPSYGKVEVAVRCSSARVEIIVADRGPGISQEDQAKLFGKYVRLSAQPTGNESSLGLGLYIVKKMCVRLGLDVRVRSQLGRGTSFILTKTFDS
jgi:signal transduction histidine kinase